MSTQKSVKPQTLHELIMRMLRNRLLIRYHFSTQGEGTFAIAEIISAPEYCNGIPKHFLCATLRVYHGEGLGSYGPILSKVEFLENSNPHRSCENKLASILSNWTVTGPSFHPWLCADPFICVHQVNVPDSVREYESRRLPANSPVLQFYTGLFVGALDQYCRQLKLVGTVDPRDSKKLEAVELLLKQFSAFAADGHREFLRSAIGV